MADPIDRLFIANRGEIAARIIATARRLGIETVLACADDDADSPPARRADRLARLGSGELSDTYLNIEKLVGAAVEHGCDALHPGYGFLSENPQLARAVADSEVSFVGPPAKAMEIAGSKLEARDAMREAGVPVVPGYHPEQETGDGEIAMQAEEIGYPVLVKAVAGGGGKGMRIVREPDKLGDSLKAARREAENAFGNARVYLEKLIERPRHIEVQVFADRHGNAVHLGERECSIQRRHQKIIEEAPSAVLTGEQRRDLGTTALDGVRAMDYENAGTVEFIYDEETGDFYFLEVNARLQVEHPVTEHVYGVDLVEWQLRVAQGEEVPKTQEELNPTGHAIEARLYAEDPASNFMPSTGELLACEFPGLPNLRVDSGVEAGSEISANYDPMIAKLIGTGGDREQARTALLEGLRETTVQGVRTNRGLLIETLAHPEFIEADLSTHFLDETGLLEEIKAGEPEPEALAAAALLPYLQGARDNSRAGRNGQSALPDPWETLSGWSL